MNYRSNQNSNRANLRNTQITQNTAIDKYRSVLNLPARPSQKRTNSPIRHRGVLLSEQAAKLIALSIKGLLNS